MKIDRIRLDIDKKFTGIIPSVQWDNNTRYLHINVLNGTEAFNLSGYSVKVAGLKPDGTSFFNDVRVINAREGFIEVVLTEQMNAAAGSVRCELKLYNSQGVLSTQPFIIYVETSVTPKGIVSSNEFKALEEALSKVNNIDTKFESLTESTVKAATEKEIQKQIASGNMANLAIPNGSITKEKLSPDIKFDIDDGTFDGKKLKQNTINLSKIDYEGLLKNDYYSKVVAKGYTSCEFIAKGTTIPGSASTSEISTMIYSEQEGTLRMEVFLNDDGGTSNFINKQTQCSKAIKLTKGFNKIHFLVDNVDKSHQYIIWYFVFTPTTGNNINLYVSEDDLSITGFNFTTISKRSYYSTVYVHKWCPFQLINNQNMTKFINDNDKGFRSVVEDIVNYSSQEYSIDIGFTESKKEGFVCFQLPQAELQKIIGTNTTGNLMKVSFDAIIPTGCYITNISLWYAANLGVDVPETGGAFVFGKNTNGNITTFEGQISTYNPMKRKYVKVLLTVNSDSGVTKNYTIKNFKIDINSNNVSSVIHDEVAIRDISGKVSVGYNNKTIVNIEQLLKTKAEIEAMVRASGAKPSRWKGKKYLALGDSITWANGNSVVGGNTLIGYQKRIADNLGMKLDTFAVGGMDIRGLWGYFKSGYVESQVKNADLITILMTTNDFGLGNPLGEISNLKASTFADTVAGNYQAILKKIFEWNPTVTVIILTPLQRTTGETPNKVNATLLNYVDMVKGVAGRTSCYCLDLYRELGINSLNLDQYTYDGLHPNQKGHDLLGEYCTNKIEQY